MADAHSSPRGGGLPLALGAYAIWGLLPLYLRLVHHVPPFEFVGWRIVFTVPVCAALLIWRRGGADLLAVLRQPRLLLRLLASELLIGINWTVYVVAIQQGHVLATSLGYYINPLVNVLFGTVLLGERLTRRQWGAVALAVLGVGLLAWGARDTLWIALTLAFSFSAYGLVRKVTPVGPLVGLTVEAAVLVPIAAGVVWWYAGLPTGSALNGGWADIALIACSGVLTAVPLMLFAAAAHRMDYSLLGMVQFLAPTIVFVLGLTVFGEALRPVQLVSFVLIWAALALFVADLLAQRRARGRLSR